MRQEKVKVDGVWVDRRELEDWTELLTYGDKVLAGADGVRFGGMVSSSLMPEKSDGWYQSDSLDHALNLARYGWPEGRARLGDIQAKLNILQYLPLGFRTQPHFALAGDEPDVGRMLSGEPEHMMTMQPRIVRNGKLIRLVVQVSYPWTTTTEQVFRRGAAVLACLEIVQMLGYTLEIKIVRTAHRGTRVMETYVPIHHAGDRLNLDTLAFMLVHPSVLRRLFFAYEECETSETRRLYGYHDQSGYGTPEQAIALPVHDCFVSDPFGFPRNMDQTFQLTLKILDQCGIKLHVPSAA